MDKCIYEPIHGEYPKCNGACKKGKDNYCCYYFTDDFWHTMNDWKKEAGVTSPVQWKVDDRKHKIYIYTNRPGYFIGYHGKLYEKYKPLLNKTIQHEIEFVECDDYID
jgi:hypothetical protein